jgi:hypothetical protein
MKGHTLICVNQYELNLGPVDPIDDLERPPSQQGQTYDEMRRQAIWAFNLCCIFAGLGVLQVLVGLAGVYWNSKVGLSLLGSGGFFGTLSAWVLKLSRSANSQLERITSHEKAREMIDRMTDASRKNEEASKYLKTLLTQSKNC